MKWFMYVVVQHIKKPLIYSTNKNIVLFQIFKLNIRFRTHTKDLLQGYTHYDLVIKLNIRFSYNIVKCFHWVEPGTPPLHMLYHFKTLNALSHELNMMG